MHFNYPPSGDFPSLLHAPTPALGHITGGMLGVGGGGGGGACSETPHEPPLSASSNAVRVRACMDRCPNSRDGTRGSQLPVLPPRLFPYDKEGTDRAEWGVRDPPCPPPRRGFPDAPFHTTGPPNAQTPNVPNATPPIPPSHTTLPVGYHTTRRKPHRYHTDTVPRAFLESVPRIEPGYFPHGLETSTIDFNELVKLLRGEGSGYPKSGPYRSGSGRPYLKHFDWRLEGPFPAEVLAIAEPGTKKQTHPINIPLVSSPERPRWRSLRWGLRCPTPLRRSPQASGCSWSYTPLVASVGPTRYMIRHPGTAG